MRLCRFGDEVNSGIGLYDERGMVPLSEAAQAFANATGEAIQLPNTPDLLAFLPPDGPGFATARRVADWADANRGALPPHVVHNPDVIGLQYPIPRPNKIFLLAGNYADHIREGGGVAAEREETFPYVFMKPPSTTLTNPGTRILVPKASPDAIDWELELAVVIGRRIKSVSEAAALQEGVGCAI